MQSARVLRAVVVCLGMLLAVPVAASAQLPTSDDPRVGLAPGFENPGTAANGLQHLANRAKPAGFFNAANPGDFGFLTSDMAFQGDHAFVGGFNGFQIWNIANPAAPTLTTAVICPGGQGDLSVYQNLLFMSVEESRARVDCGTNPAVGTRFQGVRIFDISNIAAPVQVAAVQACRGSHTHTLVTDADDPNNVYIYVQGTAGVRPASTMAGCNNNPASGENPSRWRIEVIKVPVAAPQNAAIVERAATVRERGGRCRRAPEHPPDADRIRRASGGRRSRSRTPATTSPSTRRSSWRPAPARATAS